MRLNRHSREPLLRPTKNDWENQGVFNPAAVMVKGKINLLYRAQGKDGISRLGRAEMRTATEVEERKSTPVFGPDPDSEYEALGTEDPRISLMGETCYMTYVAVSKYPSVLEKPVHEKEEDWRVRVCLAKTTDLESWIRYGVIISHIDSKDAALFPEKIDDNFCLLHRVIPQIRIAVASDARRYKERGPVFGPRAGMWDEWRVGIGAPPVKSPFGWLLFYHGVDNKQVYRLGLGLLDLHDPSLVVARTTEPILEPVESWEKAGRVKNVVFTCGVAEDAEKYWVYYGAADTVVGVASIERRIVWDWAREEMAKSRFHEFEQIGKITTEETQERMGK